MKKRISLFLALCALAVLCTVIFASAQTFTNPVAPGADPFVFRDDDGTYYLYATSGGGFGYRVYRSENLVEWESLGWCLTRADVYTNQTEGYADKGVYNFWAPEVYKIGDKYVLFYTAQEHVGVAVADNPTGPFTNDAASAGYILDGVEGFGKYIDAHLFEDDGQYYLYFVSCGAASCGGQSVLGGNNIWGVEFNAETLTIDGTPKLLVPYTSGGVAEGPEMIKNGDTYYLTYSNNGYDSAAYNIGVATSSSPLGIFAKQGTIFISDDTARTDTNNPHFYGVGHHCFVKSPDGTELWVLYHAHRSGKKATGLKDALGLFTSNDPDNAGKVTVGDQYVEERVLCLDKAVFDAQGLHIGTNKTPTTAAQTLPSGGSLAREMKEDGVFSASAFAALPTVYVAGKGGNDENDGLTPNTAVRSMDRAYALLPNGGTMILTEGYEMTGGTTRTYYNSTLGEDNKRTAELTVDYPLVTETDWYNAPAVNGPVLIKGAFSAVPVRFKFWSFNSDTYLEDLTLQPATTGAGTGSISVIEGRRHNIVIGEGVSCISRAVTTCQQFPVLVGGYWLYTADYTNKNATTYPYIAFTGADQYALVKGAVTAPYAVKIYGGTWSIATERSVVGTSSYWDNGKQAQDDSSTLVVGENALLRPSAAKTLTVKNSGEGAVLTFAKVANDTGLYPMSYAIYRDGVQIATLDGSETEYVDTDYALGETAVYNYAGYVNGACIGDALKTPVSFTAPGDVDGQDGIDIKDVFVLLKDILNGTDAEHTLVDVLVLMKYLSK